MFDELLSNALGGWIFYFYFKFLELRLNSFQYFKMQKFILEV